MRHICILLVFLLINSACVQISSKPITEVSQKELESVVLIDVRTPEEFAVGHLENALNINWLDPNFAAQFTVIDKTKTIYVYCKKGGRSAKAQKKLKTLGFAHVVNLEGGYEAYKEVNAR